MIENKYLSGKELYGDNFNDRQIKEWFKDEEEGYSGLFESYKNKNYDYHELNKLYGYEKLKRIKIFDTVLSFGGAKGDELLPVIKKIKKIIIIEASKKLRVKEIYGKKIKYLTPRYSGKINLPNGNIDLITCFGVLHHIPNFSFVFGELNRVLKKGGYILIREPIVSMGDWTKPRRGLTKRERGIPIDYFRKVIKNNNIKIISEEKVLFPLTRKLKINNSEISNSKLAIWIDYFFSKLFLWNNHYHSTNFLHKLRPQSVFYVLQK